MVEQDFVGVPVFHSSFGPDGPPKGWYARNPTRLERFLAWLQRVAGWVAA